MGRYAGEKLAGPRRAAAVAWLWRVQQQEENTAVRCRELLTLYKLGEAKVLAALVQDIERNGVAWLTEEHDRRVSPAMWWQWLKEVRDR